MEDKKQIINEIKYTILTILPLLIYIMLFCCFMMLIEIFEKLAIWVFEMLFSDILHYSLIIVNVITFILLSKKKKLKSIIDYIAILFNFFISLFLLFEEHFILAKLAAKLDWVGGLLGILMLILIIILCIPLILIILTVQITSIIKLINKYKNCGKN